MILNKIFYWIINLILSATAGLCTAVYFLFEQNSTRRSYRASLMSGNYSSTEFLIIFAIGAIPIFILLCKGYKGYVAMLNQDKNKT